MDENLLQSVTIGQNETMEAAMIAIEGNSRHCLIVLNEAGIVVGTISDGDIRRSLLDRRLPTTPIHQVMNTNFIALTPDRISEATAIFERMHINLIPIIDERGLLLDIVREY